MILYTIFSISATPEVGASAFGNVSRGIGTIGLSLGTIGLLLTTNPYDNVENDKKKKKKKKKN